MVDSTNPVDAASNLDPNLPPNHEESGDMHSVSRRCDLRNPHANNVERGIIIFEGKGIPETALNEDRKRRRSDELRQEANQENVIMKHSGYSEEACGNFLSAGSGDRTRRDQ